MERINRKQKKFSKVKSLKSISFFKLLGISQKDVDEIFVAKPYSRKIVKGKRIMVPCQRLKEVQERVARLLTSIKYVSPIVHSYTKKRSILTCIDKHRWAETILCIDIKNFFESIPQHEIRSYFKKTFYMYSDLFWSTMAKSFGIDEEVLEKLFIAEGIEPESSCPMTLNDYDIDLLIKFCCRNGHLPIGAPSSPILSNIVLENMDSRINNFCHDRGFTYTRYADDMIFSCRFKLTKAYNNARYFRPTSRRAGVYRHNLRKFLPIIIDILKYYGFKVNHKKIKYMRNKSAKKLFNIIINDRGKRSVCRKYRRRVRAERHQLELHNSSAKKGNGLLDYREDINEEKVQGKEAWIKHVDNRQPKERPKGIQVVDKNPFPF